MEDILESEVVQKTPPSLRSKSIRVLGPKTTVAARIDSNAGDSMYLIYIFILLLFSILLSI